MSPTRSAPFGVGLTEMAAIVIVAASVVSYVPGTVSPWWVPRNAAALLILPLGVLLLWRLVLKRDRCAMVASGVLVWALITSVSSNARFVSLIGTIGRPSSVVVLTSVVGSWAIGRAMSTRWKDSLGWVVVALFFISAAVALVQMAVQPIDGYIGLELGRPTGLAGGPIYFGAHASACAAWFSYHLMVGRSSWDLAGFAAASFFAGLSGSRVALLTTLGIAGWSLIRGRTARTAATIPVVVATAFLASLVHRAAGTGQSAGDRVGTSGIGDRVELWGYGISAWAEQPIQGWGVARFRPATQSQFLDEWVSRYWSDTRHVWFDAHNYFVEVLVTTGIVGLALTVLFVVFASRRAAGPLLWMAAVIAVGWMVEPASMSTYALAALLLGAAAQAVPPDPLTIPGETRAPGRSGWLAVAVGAGLASWFLVAGAVLDHRFQARSSQDFGGASVWFRFDPVAANSMATGALSVLNDDPGIERDRLALLWTQRAADREPDFTLWWGLLGIRSLRVDDLEGARHAAQEGLALQSNHPVSLQVLQIVGIRTDDAALVNEMTERLCRVGLGDECAG